jgi:hypothetical protein
MTRIVGDYASARSVYKTKLVMEALRFLEMLMERRGVPREERWKYRMFILHLIDVVVEFDESDLVVGS